MAPILPIGQAATDVLARQGAIEEAQTEPFEEDPFLDVILASPRLSPQTKAFLRASERQRRERAKLEAELQKLRMDEDRPGVVSWLGPVPIGFQLGTAAGVQGVPGLLMDIVLDPVNLIAGVGVLSKLGRASKLLKGLSPAAKAEKIFGAARLLGTAYGDDALRVGIAEAASSGDVMKLESLFSANKLRRPSKELLSGIAQVDPEFAAFLRNERGSIEALTRAFSIEDQTSKLSGAKKFLEQFRTGERAFLRFGIPFFGPTFGEIAAEGIVKKTALGEVLDTTKVGKLIDDLTLPRAQEAIQSTIDMRGIGKATSPAMSDQPFRIVKKLSEAEADAIRVAEKAPDEVMKASIAIDRASDPLKAAKAKAVGEIAQAAKVTADDASIVASELLSKIGNKAVTAKTLAQIAGDVGKTLAPGPADSIREFLKAPEAVTYVERIQQLRQTEDFLGAAKLANEAAKVGADHLHGVGKLSRSVVSDFESLDKIKGQILESQKKLIEFKRLVKGADEITPKKKILKIQEERHLADLKKELRATEQRFKHNLSVLIQTHLGRSRQEFSSAAKISSASELAAEISRAMSKSAKDALKGKKFPAIAPPATVAKTVESAEDMLKAGISKSGEPTSAVQKEIQERAIARFSSSTEAADIATFTSMRSNVIEAVKIADGFGETPGEFVRAVSGLVNFTRSYPSQMAKVINVIARGDEDLLKRIWWHLGDPDKGYLKAAPDSVKTLSDEIRETLRQTRDVLIDEDILHDFVTNYAPRITVVKDAAAQKKLEEYLISNAFRQRGFAGAGATRHAKQRAFASIEDLKDFQKKNPGLVELKTERADEAFEIYMRSVLDALVRKKTFRTLATLPAGADAGMKIAMQATEIEGLPRHLRPAFQAAYVATNDVRLAGTVIHKEYINAIKAIFDRDTFFDPSHPAVTIGEKFLRAVEYVSNLGKSMIFRLSMVHPTNLFAGAMPGLGLFDLKAAAQMFRSSFGSTARNISDITAASLQSLSKSVQFSRGIDGKVMDLGSEIADAMLSGLTFGRAEFGAVDIMDDFLKKAEATVPVIKHPITGLRHLNKWMDGNLWEIWQNGMKFFYYQQMKASWLLKDPSLRTDIARFSKIKREIAAFGNQMFGGLAWQDLLINPSMRRFLRISLIAADWTTSNLLTARDLILNAPGIRNTKFAKMLTPDVMMRDVRFQLAARYYTNVGIYAFLFGNAAQMAFTGKTLFDADKDAYDNNGFPRIELPWHRWDGRKQYMDFMKQFTEPIEWAKPILTGELKNLGEFLYPKLGTLPRLFTANVIGYNPGTGYPIYGAEDGPLKQIYNAASETVGAFVPITGQQIYQVMAGNRDWRSALLSSVGFQVRTERKEAATERTRTAELERLLQE